MGVNLVDHVNVVDQGCAGGNSSEECDEHGNSDCSHVDDDLVLQKSVFLLCF
ncbi:hypothetical protein D3C80_2131980 [compost metagenome]